MQDLIVRKQEVTAKQIVVVVYSPVQIWHCLFFTKCHITIRCLSNHFGEIISEKYFRVAYNISIFRSNILCLKSINFLDIRGIIHEDTVVDTVGNTKFRCPIS